MTDAMTEVDPRVHQRPASVGRMFLDRVAASGPAEAFRYPDGDGWRSLTWEQTGERVRAIAAGLL
jgi:long-chain acyl-CoA synthetase